MVHVGYGWAREPARRSPKVAEGNCPKQTVVKALGVRSRVDRAERTGGQRGRRQNRKSEEREEKDAGPDIVVGEFLQQKGSESSERVANQEPGDGYWLQTYLSPKTP